MKTTSCPNVAPSVHTARDFSDFPLGRMFTEDDPYFLNVKQLARGYEEYANKHKLVGFSLRLFPIEMFANRLDRTFGRVLP